jgi:hypothetical protein
MGECVSVRVASPTGEEKLNVVISYRICDVGICAIALDISEKECRDVALLRLLGSG